MNKSIETVGQRKQVCDPRRMMFKQLKGSREGKGKKQLPITMFLQIKNKNKNIFMSDTKVISSSVNNKKIARDK